MLVLMMLKSFKVSLKKLILPIMNATEEFMIFRTQGPKFKMLLKIDRKKLLKLIVKLMIYHLVLEIQQIQEITLLIKEIKFKILVHQMLQDFPILKGNSKTAQVVDKNYRDNLITLTLRLMVLIMILKKFRMMLTLLQQHLILLTNKFQQQTAKSKI